MNCHYCHQETTEVSRMSIHPNQLTLWFMCEICHVSYEIHNDVLVNKSIFALTIRKRSYCVQLLIPEKQTQINYWDAFEATPTVNLHVFNFLVDWTPFNAREKLQRLLVFM